MQRLGDQVLAGAALSADEHVHRAVADTLYEPEDVFDLGARADNLVTGELAFHFAPQMRVFLGQLTDRPRGLDGDRNLRGERFQNFLVLGVERTVALIEDFERANHFPVDQVLERRRQQIASVR